MEWAQNAKETDRRAAHQKVLGMTSHTCELFWNWLCWLD